MSKRITHEQAFDALCDPDVTVTDALWLFVKAHRRTNAASRGFILHTAGAIRKKRMENADLTDIDKKCRFEREGRPA